MPLFKYVGSMTVGKEFGELALLQGYRRSASILAKSKKVYCLSISKDIYRRINANQIMI